MYSVGAGEEGLNEFNSAVGQLSGSLSQWKRRGLVHTNGIAWAD